MGPEPITNWEPKVTLCPLDNCDREQKVRGYCKRHYYILRRAGALSAKPMMKKGTRPCAVDGCATAAVAKGMCQKHLIRVYRHSDPHHCERVYAGTTDKWLRDHVNHSGGECLPWPFATDNSGYGQACLGSKSYQAHAAMCILAHGPRPFSGAYACHSCGKGHLGCVNPTHLKWSAPRENSLDRWAHGTMHYGESVPGAKLTREKALLIFHATEFPTAIARRFGVSRRTVTDIKLGKSWSWLTGKFHYSREHLRSIYDAAHV